MPTLAEDLQQLLAVQEVDSRLDRARAEQSGLDTGAALAAAYNVGKTEFEKLKADAVHAQGEQRDAELRLKTIEDKITAENAKMYGSTALGAKELSNLQKEVEGLGRQKGDAEEKALAAMETAEQTLTRARKAEAALLRTADEYKKVRAHYKDRHAALTGEIADIEKERAGVAAPVTPALLARYDAIRARRNGVGVAVLDAEANCGACRTRNSSGIAGEVRALRAAQTCENCGRILVPSIEQ